MPLHRGAKRKETDDDKVKDDLAKAKKPRGRRRIADINAELAQQFKKDEDNEDLDKPRSSRRPRINYRELNERGKEDGDDDLEDGEDEDAAQDIADVLDGDFSADFVSETRTVEEEEDEPEPLEEEQDEAFELVIPHRKFGKRRISLNPIATKKLKEKGNKPKTKEPVRDYDVCKELICVVCAKELNQQKLESYANLYEGKTKSGKSLYEMVTALIKQDIQPVLFGSRLCPQCLQSLNEIEALYHDYRRATESFLDKFEVGQKILDADAVSAESTDSVKSLASFVFVPKCVVKVINPMSSSFNAYAVGSDFHAPPAKIYNASVLPQGEIPPESLQGEENNDGIITITFDQTTGIIEKTVNYSMAEIAEEDVDPNLVHVYMSQEEFDGMKKSLTKNVLYMQREEFEQVCCRLLFGKRIKQQFALCGVVSQEYQKHIQIHSTERVYPCNEENRFTCSDCSASYPTLHMLSNHVQSHPDEEAAGERGDDGWMMTIPADATPGEDAVRTGETATLEKPFQCERCDKCFSEYLTLSTHIDHYHGFRRTCNIENCDFVGTHIQDFVQHYANHADSNFQVPSEFKLKTKVVLPCPMCNINIQGVWKYFHHSFTHDKEPRFKCPACGKRTHKVQNFKDHLVKHHRVGGIRVARNENTLPTLNLDQPGPFYCQDCGKTFSLLKKLQYHQQIHVPKDQWQFSCEACDTPFPSESRLKLHVANVHNTSNTNCILCNKSCQNRHALQMHFKEDHQDVIVQIEQS